MSDKMITIDIDQETGNFSLDLDGFHGKGCKDVAKLFEQMGKVTSSEDKPALHTGPGGGNVITCAR